MIDDRPRRPPTAQEFVLGELRRGIVTGALQPGEQIRQDALADRLGTSRVPLREALKILEGEGLVTYHPHRGYFVAALSAEDLAEVYRIRELLESEAIRCAVPLLTDADVVALEAALLDVEAATDAHDIVRITATNRAFHFLLLEHSQMPRLVRLIRQLWDSTDAYRSVYFADEHNREQVRQEHRAILDAVRTRDPERTLAMLHLHRENAVQRVTDVLEG